MAKLQVTLWEILEYIGNRNRPLKEGEAVFKAGHIIQCGVDVVNTECIKSLCLQTSSLTTSPHEVTVILHEEVKHWKCTCTCKAGLSGFCKHIIATLIYINRNDELELISCTEITQKWGKEKRAVEQTYTAKPFKKFCHPEVKKKYVFHTSPEVESINFKFLCTGVGNSALTTFLGRAAESVTPRKVDKERLYFSIFTMVYRPLQLLLNILHFIYVFSSFFLPFFCFFFRETFVLHVEKLIQHAHHSPFLKSVEEKIKLEQYNLSPCCEIIINSLNNSNTLEIAIKYTQGSNMWKKERQLRITGSTCYSIYTYKGEDWKNKSLNFFFPKGFVNKFTEYGLKYETEALEAFKSLNGCLVVTPSLVICQLMPWLGFSPDGVIFDNGKPTKLIEIKCPFIGKDNPPEKIIESCDYLEVVNSKVQLKTKHRYYGQVQLGMTLLNVPETHFLVYSSFSKTFLDINLRFDSVFAEDLIKKISDNYFRHMLHNYCLNQC